MIDRAINCFNSARASVCKTFEERNYFKEKEDERYTDEEIVRALKFVISSQSADFHNFC